MDILSSNVTIDDLVIDRLALSEAIRNSFTRDPFEHYVNGICALFFCIIGCVSNALSFSVLIRRTMRLSTYVYLTGLCLSDFVTCLFLIPGYILDAFPLKVLDYELPRTYAYTKLLIIAQAISITGRVLSVLLCAAFTIDRWIMICRPFIGPLYCTIKNARRVTLIIFLTGVFYAIPLLYEYEPYEDRVLSEILSDHYRKKIYQLKLSETGRNSVFRWIYVLINSMFVYVIPLTLIAVLNRQLFTSIKSLEQRSEEYNAPLPTKQGVTVMLLATTIMLLVLRLPSATVWIMWLINAKMFVNEKAPFYLRKFQSIANLCATINAATTFIPFIIYGAKFRSEFTRLYCYLLNNSSKTRHMQQPQQLEQFLPKQTQTNESNLDTNGKTTKSSVKSSNGHLYVELSKDTRSSLSRLSNASYSPMKNRLSQQPSKRYSYDVEHDLMMTHAKINRLNSRQNQIPIREDDRNDNKTESLRGSYFTWFKNLFGFH